MQLKHYAGAGEVLRECFLKDLPEAAFAENPGHLQGLAAKHGMAANQGK